MMYVLHRRIGVFFLVIVIAVSISWLVFIVMKIECSLSWLNYKIGAAAWHNINTQVPKEHGYIEVMVPESHPSTLVTKVVMLNGNLGGIKFWRPIKETEK